MNGVKYLQCGCGWITLKPSLVKAGRCEACEAACPEKTHVGPHAQAEMIAWAVETVTNALDEHARKHGLLVWRQSPRKYVVFRVACNQTTAYGDNEARSYPCLEAVYHGSYQAVMSYIKDKTPDLPKHLKENQ